MLTRIHLVTTLAVCLLCGAAGCGSPGVPMPPSLQLPNRVNDLAAIRKGDRVVLTWTEPTETTDRQRLRRLGLTVICRAVGEYPMMSCAQTVAQLRPQDLHSAPAARGRAAQVVFEDVLSAQMQSASQFATYAIEVQNTQGKSAGLSNQMRLPLAPAVSSATEVRAEVTPDAVILRWTAASPPSASPSLGFFYRVFRKEANAPEYSLLQEIPLKAGTQTFSDHGFEWEHSYDYKVTGLTRLQSSGAEAVEFEGADSRIVPVFPHDIFPPAVPTGIQAVFSGVGQKPFIDLTWAPDTEADLAGYNVFRGEPGGPMSQINPQLLKAPSYRDENVLPGNRYQYAVNAVDVRGNQSGRSEVATESVPSL